MHKVLAVIVVLLGVLFLVLDIPYSMMISSGSRGELWGPVSFFQPIVKWFWIAATALLCIKVLCARRCRCDPSPPDGFFATRQTPRRD